MWQIATDAPVYNFAPKQHFCTKFSIKNIQERKKNQVRVTPTYKKSLKLPLKRTDLVIDGLVKVLAR